MHSLRTIKNMNYKHSLTSVTANIREDRIARENRAIAQGFKIAVFGIFMLAVALYAYLMV